jgi:hypothetical protein
MTLSWECTIITVHYNITFRELELEYVNLLRSPGIDSQPGEPIRQPYLKYRPARPHRLAESIPLNRFLCVLKVYKYGLCWVFGLSEMDRSDQVEG